MIFRSIHNHNDMWALLETNWDNFYWLTGEIPPSLNYLVQEIENEINLLKCGCNAVMTFRNQVLLTVIWLRCYPTMQHLGMHFGVPVSCIHCIIYKILPILHVVAVPKYIQWHSPQMWTSLAGTIPEWPQVVAILDGTPFRISRPKGRFQCIFFRGDCRAIKQGMVIVNTWVFILRRYKWHIHAGSWSLVNCWREALTGHYIRCS